MFSTQVRRAYTVGNEPMEWRGTFEEGGDVVELTGSSFAEIEGKAKALNPTFSIFDNSTAAAIEARDGRIAARQTVGGILSSSARNTR